MCIIHMTCIIVYYGLTILPENEKAVLCLFVCTRHCSDTVHVFTICAIWRKIYNVCNYVFFYQILQFCFNLCLHFIPCMTVLLADDLYLQIQKPVHQCCHQHHHLHHRRGIHHPEWTSPVVLSPFHPPWVWPQGQCDEPTGLYHAVWVPWRSLVAWSVALSYLTGRNMNKYLCHQFTQLSVSLMVA